MTTILVRNADSVAVYAGVDLVLTDNELRGRGWRNPHFTTSNAQLLEAELPANWSGGVWSYIAGEWAVVDEVQHAIVLAEVRRQTVPESVPIYNAELVLLQAGHLTLVKAAIESAGSLAQLAWARRLNVRRDDPLVLQLTAAFEWTDEYVDAMFIAAGAIE